MEFTLFMTGFALALALILWLILRSGKSRSVKRTHASAKNLPQRKNNPAKKKTALKASSNLPNRDQLRKNAIELLKKKPDVVREVVRQWLREK